jgi:hypothetical protein
MKDSKNMTDRELLFEHFQADLDFQKNVLERLERIDNRLDPEKEEYILKAYVPLLEAWQGLSFIQKLFIGAGSLAGALAAIGAAVWWGISNVHFPK